MGKLQTGIEVLDRLAENTPKYWKRVRSIALTVAAGAGAVLIADKIEPFGLSAELIQYLKYASAAGVFLAATAQTASTER